MTAVVTPTIGSRCRLSLAKRRPGEWQLYLWKGLVVTRWLRWRITINICTDLHQVSPIIIRICSTRRMETTGAWAHQSREECCTIPFTTTIRSSAFHFYMHITPRPSAAIIHQQVIVLKGEFPRRAVPIIITMTVLIEEIIMATRKVAVARHHEVQVQPAHRIKSGVPVRIKWHR